MAQQEPTRKRHNGAGPSGPGAPSREIPDKLYFRIGEVAQLCEVPAYVLRFWESEFPQLKPNKGGTGQRLYRRRDVETALRVKALLYDEGYTIAGARQAFKAERTSAARTPGPSAPTASTAASPGVAPEPVETLTSASEVRAGTVDARLVALQKDLRELHALLSKPPSTRQVVQPIRAPKRSAEPAEPMPRPTPAPTPFARPKLITPIKPPAPKVERGLFDALPPAES